MMQEFRPPYRLNKGQYARVVRETGTRDEYDTKADYISALWVTARRLYPSLVGII